jgi:hypothetical protein
VLGDVDPGDILRVHRVAADRDPFTRQVQGGPARVQVS